MKERALMAGRIVYLLAITLPAWVAYVLFLGYVTIDFRSGPMDPVFSVPGWGPSELSWVIRRPSF